MAAFEARKTGRVAPMRHASHSDLTRPLIVQRMVRRRIADATACDASRAGNPLAFNAIANACAAKFLHRNSTFPQPLCSRSACSAERVHAVRVSRLGGSPSGSFCQLFIVVGSSAVVRDPDGRNGRNCGLVWVAFTSRNSGSLRRRTSGGKRVRNLQSPWR